MADLADRFCLVAFVNAGLSLADASTALLVSRRILEQHEDAERSGREQTAPLAPIVARPVVRWFAEQMELALRQDGWRDEEPEDLLSILRSEVDDLEDEACEYERPKTAVAQAIIVANLAMMVADHFRDGGPSQDQGYDLPVPAQAGEAANNWTRLDVFSSAPGHCPASNVPVQFATYNGATVGYRNDDGRWTDLLDVGADCTPNHDYTDEHVTHFAPLLPSPPKVTP